MFWSRYTAMPMSPTPTMNVPTMRHFRICVFSTMSFKFAAREWSPVQFRQRQAAAGLSRNPSMRR